jgi:hypothetical protein
MVTLHRAETWKISVYGRDHWVPHFHIEGREFRCSISIATLEVIIGAAPPGVLRVAIAWARGNQVELMAKWRELNE